MKLSFLGHAGFLLDTGSDVLAIDPYITENPVAKVNLNELHPNYILVTHGHHDHMGDTLEIAKANDATVVSVTEITKYFTAKGAKTHGMHIGGGHDFGGFRLKLTNALHGSSLGGIPLQYLGNPCGFLISVCNKCFYHAGDTGLFGDMELIGRLNPIDFALLPIGDNFTMGPNDAFEAVRLLQPKKVIPMHYNTWEIIEQNPVKFKDRLAKELGIDTIIMTPGDVLTID